MPVQYVNWPVRKVFLGFMGYQALKSPNYLMAWV